MTKTCSHCKKTKPVADFNKRQRSSDGLRSNCRECDKTLRYREPGPTAGEGSPPRESSPSAPGTVGISSKVVGRIEPVVLSPPAPATGTKIVSAPVQNDRLDEEAARQYAQLLNKGLPIRARAKLMIEIAKSVKGPTAAIALAALKDINLATKVTDRGGAQVDIGPLFALPAGSDVKMSG